MRINFSAAQRVAAGPGEMRAQCRRGGRVLGTFAAAVLLLAAWARPAGAAPDLTEMQQQVLATAQDHGAMLDEAALYPLLDNALQWTPGEEAGAMLPDYKAVAANPGKYRGQLFLIEGVLGQKPVPVDSGESRLARPGPWSGKVQMYGILVHRQPDEVVVVYLADPPTGAGAPAVGDHVRLVARFFKIWNAKDKLGNAASYPAFVGQTAKVMGSSGGGSGGNRLFMGILLAAVVGGGSILVMAWRRNAQMTSGRDLRERQREREEARGADELAEEEAPLPEDPAEAMIEMERRRKIARGQNPDQPKGPPESFLQQMAGADSDSTATPPSSNDTDSSATATPDEGPPKST